jgi:hypothetical protein
MSKAKQPPRRQTPEAVTNLAEEALRLRSRIETMRDATETEVSKIDPRFAAPAQRTEETRIRQLYGQTVQPLLARLAEIRGEVQSQEQHFTRDAARARASFDKDPVRDAQIGLYWNQRIAAASPRELVEIARFGASEFNHALGLSIEREIDRRGLRSNEICKAAIELVESIPLAPQDVAVGERIRTVLIDVDLTAVESAEVATGRRNPEGRMAIGLAQTRPPLDRKEGSAELGAGLSTINAGQDTVVVEHVA